MAKKKPQPGGSTLPSSGSMEFSEIEDAFFASEVKLEHLEVRGATARTTPLAQTSAKAPVLPPPASTSVSSLPSLDLRSVPGNEAPPVPSPGDPAVWTHDPDSPERPAGVSSASKPPLEASEQGDVVQNSENRTTRATPFDVVSGRLELQNGGHPGVGHPGVGLPDGGLPDGGLPEALSEEGNASALEGSWQDAASVQPHDAAPVSSDGWLSTQESTLDAYTSGLRTDLSAGDVSEWGAEGWSTPPADPTEGAELQTSHLLYRPVSDDVAAVQLSRVSTGDRADRLEQALDAPLELAADELDLGEDTSELALSDDLPLEDEGDEHQGQEPLVSEEAVLAHADEGIPSLSGGKRADEELELPADAHTSELHSEVFPVEGDTGPEDIAFRAPVEGTPSELAPVTQTGHEAANSGEAEGLSGEGADPSASLTPAASAVTPAASAATPAGVPGERSFLPSAGDLESLSEDDDDGLERVAEITIPALGLDPDDLPEPLGSEIEQSLPATELPPELFWSAEQPAARRPGEAGEDAASTVRHEATRLDLDVPVWGLPEVETAEIEVIEEDPAEVETEPSQELEPRFTGPVRLPESMLSPIPSLEEQLRASIALLGTEALTLEGGLKAAYVVERARLQAEGGQVEDALESLNDALSAHDTFQPALQLRLSLARAQGRSAAVIDALELNILACENPLARAGFYLRLAAERMQLAGRYEVGRGDVVEAIQLTNGHRGVLLEALRLADTFGTVSDQAPLLVRLADVSTPLLAEARLLEAARRVEELAPEQALSFREQALMWRSSLGARLALEQQLLAHDQAEALAALELRLEPLEGEELPLTEVLRRVDRLATQGDFQTATFVLQSALERAPLNPFLRREYQGWLVRIGDWHGWLATLEQELQHVGEPTPRALLYFMASLACSGPLQQLERAQGYLQAALETSPDFELGRLELERLQQKLANPAEQARLLQDLAAEEPEATRAAARYFQAGVLLDHRTYALGDALFCYQRAVELEPERAIYRFFQRYTLERLGHWETVHSLASSWPFESLPHNLATSQHLELLGAQAEFRGVGALAIPYYREAFELGSRSPLALGGLLRLLPVHSGLESLLSLLVRVGQESQPTGAREASLALRWVLLSQRSHELSAGAEQDHLNPANNPADNPAEQGVRAAAEALEQLLAQTEFLPARWALQEARLDAGDPASWQALLSERLERMPQDPVLEMLASAILRSRRGLPQPLVELEALDERGNVLAQALLESLLLEQRDTRALANLYERRLSRLSDPSSRRYVALRCSAWLELAGEFAQAMRVLYQLTSDGHAETFLLDRVELLALKANEQVWLTQEWLSRCVAGKGRGLQSRVFRRAWQAGTLPELLLQHLGVENLGVEHLGLEHLDVEQAAYLSLSQGDIPASARAHAMRVLAGALTGEEQSAFADQAGRLFLTLQAPDEAQSLLEQAIHTPFEGERVRLLAELAQARGAVAALEALYQPVIAGTSGETEQLCVCMELADMLEGMGAVDNAVSHFSALSEQRFLPACLRLERIHLASQAWEPYVLALESRAASVQNEAEREGCVRLARQVRAQQLNDVWALEQLLAGALTQQPMPEALDGAYRRLLARQERWTDLASYLEQRVKREGNDAPNLIQNLLDLAWIYANPLDDLEQAFDKYQEVLDIQPDQNEALMSLMALCERRQDWHGMVAALARQALCQSGDAQLETYRRIARLWEQSLHDLPTALQSWQRVLAVAPDDRGALQALLDLSGRLGAWGEFVNVGEQLIQLRKDEDVRLLNAVGRAAVFHLANPELGVPYLLRAAVRGSSDVGALRAAADMFETRGALREAIELLRRSAQFSDNPAVQVECHQRIALLARERLAQPAVAVEALHEVLARIPDHLAVMTQLVGLLHELEQTEQALLQLDELLTHPALGVFLDALPLPERVRFHRQVADLLLEVGRHADAADHYEVLWQLLPDNERVLQALTGLYQALEQWEKLARLLERSLQSPLGSPEVQLERLETLARAWMRAGQADAALEVCQRMRTLSPSHMNSYRLMAEIFEQREAWSALLDMYNAVIKHARELGDVVEAYLKKADILDFKLSPGNPSYLPKAVRHYVKAVEYDRRNVYAMLRLAEISLRTLQYTQADDWLRRVLALEPASYQRAQTLMLGAILCAEVQHNQEKALNIFAKAAEAEPSLLEKQELLAAAVSRSPGNLVALLELFHALLPYRTSTTLTAAV
ncbi:MAG: hypothetical protein ACKO6N_16050 [Myxococcota bacterium]